MGWPETACAFPMDTIRHPAAASARAKLRFIWVSNARLEDGGTWPSRLGAMKGRFPAVPLEALCIRVDALSATMQIRATLVRRPIASILAIIYNGIGHRQPERTSAWRRGRC